MAHQSIGAAPPPGAPALPATTPCPGGAPGELGVRSSPAPPFAGAFVCAGSEAVAWRGGLGPCDVTSGGAGADDVMACTGGGAPDGAAHRVATPGARCEPTISAPCGETESGKPTCRVAKVGLRVPGGLSPNGKASGGGGATRTCATGAGAGDAAGGAGGAGCAVTGAAGCAALGAGCGVGVVDGVVVFVLEASPACPLEVLSPVDLSASVLDVESFELDVLLDESLEVESLEVESLVVESLPLGSFVVAPVPVCPLAGGVVEASLGGGVVAGLVVAGGGVVVGVAGVVAVSAAPVVAVDAAASVVVVVVFVDVFVVVVTAVAALPVAVVPAAVAASLTAVVAESSVEVASAAAALATGMLSAPSRTSAPTSTRREDLA